MGKKNDDKKNELKKLKPKIIRILKKKGAKKAGIFGSLVRGEQKKKSDIDILVELPKNLSLFDFVGIKLELEDALKRKVDLVEYCVIKPMIKDKILEEEVRIIWKEMNYYF